jgi:glycosyltransferase involved in cell wall biosynthesis
MNSIKIGFVLLSNSRNPFPSTRIAVLNMIPFLRDAGFDPHIVFEPETGTEHPDLPDLAQHLSDAGFRVVFFQKVHGPSVLELVRKLAAKEIATVFGVCDIVNAEMATAADATVVVTEYLKGLYPAALHPKIHVVHDGIENPSACKTDWGLNRGSSDRPLRAVLVTSSNLVRLPVIGKTPPWLQVNIVGPYPPKSHRLRRMKEVRWTLLGQRRDERLGYLDFLMDHGIRRVAWDPVGVYQHMQAADIGIIPVDPVAEQQAASTVPNWMVKSENRLTMKMSLGLPVVASPVPAYQPVLEQGKNGFLATSPADWFECLDALRDPVLRRQMGERARESVRDRFSLVAQAQGLVRVLRGLQASSVRNNTKFQEI